MNDITVGFIGFGLIGGSVARALKAGERPPRLIAYNYHKGSTPPGLALALKDGVLDAVTEDLTDFSSCGIIFLCAPVRKNIEYLSLLKPIITQDCILTDVGSVKDNIQEAARELGLLDRFIGGHPMTGSEKTGYENSYAMLLENAYYILTPSRETPEHIVNTMLSLIQSFGSIPVLLDSKEHDAITAAISHLPHIIAAQLVNLIKDSGNLSDKMRLLAAGGFKDITRIASSSPVMWENICLTNADSIRRVLGQYIKALQAADQALASRDSASLYQLFDSAGAYRNSIPNSKKGAIRNVYEIYLDIIDEAGAIATVATLLASNHISIKNIGIIHNREYEEGVLRIEFYDDTSRELALQLLKRHRYTIYDRQ